MSVFGFRTFLNHIDKVVNEKEENTFSMENLNDEMLDILGSFSILYSKYILDRIFNFYSG